MSGPSLRIFSYQPNPRVWKSTIAARLNGVVIELRGDTPEALADWLWDFEARPLTEAERVNRTATHSGRVGFQGVALHKTSAFLDAHPFGTVPAAFSPDGRIGIFESNSMARAVARLGEAQLALYGADAYEASRIDSFLDASLVFGRDTQAYLLSLRGGEVSVAAHAAARAAVEVYLTGIERALAPSRATLVGNALSIADICFACELTMLWLERARSERLAAQALEPVLPRDFGDRYPHAGRHFVRLRAHPAFAADFEPYLTRIEAMNP
ncbi:MAG: glutathione S-transferase family protein [Gammaproteobacteria bacterium]|nr:glutathione S-transferase family protein [Gammaproteobacteria bacterium]